MAEGVTRLIQGRVTSAQGFAAAGVHCGIKAQKKDLALVVSRVPAAAAGVILTTDTVSKTGAVQVTVGSQVVTVGGMSKGAGMIHPQMATTLSVLTTDASVAPAVLNSALRRAADGSFNRITVDGDRSTNDTILIFANGEAGAPEITGPGDALDAFQAALSVLT